MRANNLSILVGSLLIAALAVAEDGGKPPARRGPLKDLPSPADGEHLARIAALGDNSWLNLESPAPDPLWGKAHGRAWSPRAPYAPDLRGAFFFGEGVHGGIKRNGHYMDDLWFYDIPRHRWICLYPGIKADDGYAAIKIDADGFEATPDGHPLPIATMVHAYGMVTYDSVRKLFMSMPCPGGYWVDRIQGRKEMLPEIKARAPKHAGPWIYNTTAGHWERYKSVNPPGPGGFGATFIYVPTVDKAFCYKNKGAPICWYDPKTRDWSPIEKRGELPPWNIDPNSCYDAKRDRIYLGGGIYPVIAASESALWMFDVASESFARLAPKGAPASPNYSTNRAIMNYDSVNDTVVLIHHRVREGETAGVYIYHPARNEWEMARAFEPAAPGALCWTGFYDPETNAHYLHGAGDSRDNGTMWVYRYKRAAAAQ